MNQDPSGPSYSNQPTLVCVDRDSINSEFIHSGLLAIGRPKLMMWIASHISVVTFVICMMEKGKNEIYIFFLYGNGICFRGICYVC